MSGIKSLVKKFRNVPGFRHPYLVLRLVNSGMTDRLTRQALLASRFNRGYCSICDTKTFFVERTEWLRDEYVCIDCYSIPRQRAVVHVLDTQFPEWRNMEVHEPSAGGQSSNKIASQCPRYSSSQYMPDVGPGQTRDGVRCENLEALTFSDDSFDLFVTQDVFEHVLDPAVAFREVARVLRPGGAHVFTIPLYPHEKTLVRAERGDDGEIVHLQLPDYHGDPSMGQGWLVTREWGKDFTRFIEDASGLETEVFAISDPKLGLLGEFPEVFVTRKAK